MADDILIVDDEKDIRSLLSMTLEDEGYATLRAANADEARTALLAQPPKLAILDETDSGLDIDALKTVAEGINAQRAPERGMLLITHYQRLLDFVKPDFVHVMANGRIVKSGGPELALELEASGYADYVGEPQEAVNA